MFNSLVVSVLIYLCVMMVSQSGWLNWILGVISSASSSDRYTVWLGVAVLVFFGVNLTGLFFGSSDTMYLGLVFFLSLFFWFVSLEFFIFDSFFTGAVAHFLPSGVLGMFKWVLPVLEGVSVLIRPVTLGVRLSVNISSGRVLFGMFSLFSIFSLLLSGVSMVVLFFVGVLEFLVCFLQG
uniref:ATP synthase subunit a n=1 Tax=Pallisentis celatus TaxID=935648 RepID=V5IXC4_PALCE|nr:ATP synthase F0 subunit 6 [Pallisentis celatus]AFK50134.1 ATP synthase F0 subunit 6 [Pallisentis celatus]